MSKKTKQVIFLRSPPLKKNKKIVLQEGQEWVEIAAPKKVWVISDVALESNRKKRIFLKDKQGRLMKASYAESTFRRHFCEKFEFLRKRNESEQKKCITPELKMFGVCR